MRTYGRAESQSDEPDQGKSGQMELDGPKVGAIIFSAGGIDVALCKGCGAEIKFIKTPAGKWMPVNIRPVKVIPDEEGKFYVTSDGRVIKARPAERGEEGSVSAFIPHWATCPKFQNFKKAKK